MIQAEAFQVLLIQGETLQVELALDQLYQLLILAKDLNYVWLTYYSYSYIELFRVEAFLNLAQASQSELTLSYL